MNLRDVLHALVEAVSFGSEDNRAEAHQAVDDHFEQAPAPAAPEGKQS